jgi:hypothetical protein
MKCKQGKEQKRVELFAKSVRAFDQQLPLMLHHKFPSSTSSIDGSDGEAKSYIPNEGFHNEAPSYLLHSH